MSSVRDPAYEVRFEEQPTLNQRVYHLLVSHDGVPVSGAQVCMRANMGGTGNMSGMGVSNLASEVGPGRYELGVTLQMAGPWRGVAIVTEPNKRAVNVPLAFNTS